MSEELRIIVCAKQVPDPEGPPSSFVVEEEEKEVSIRGIPPVINPYCETALEAAIQMKEKHGGEVIVLSVGDKLSDSILSKALGAGSDKLIMLEDDELGDLESYSTAKVLKSAIEEIGDYDLVLTGRQAGDWDSGQVGIILSEFLDIPGVHEVKNIEVKDEDVIFEKAIAGGYKAIKTSKPALATITSSSKIGELRYVSVTELKKAREKPIKEWSLDDIDADVSGAKRRKVVDLTKPSRERECTIVEGESPEEMGKALASKLVEEVKSN